MNETTENAACRRTALNLLARREHARGELERKLRQRDYTEAVVATVLDRLVVERLQSNERYAEAYVHQRAEKGFGPRRIIQELKDRGIAEELINQYLTHGDFDWHSKARAVRIKRFGPSSPQGYKEQARQSQFLQYRGFSGDQIQSTLTNQE